MISGILRAGALLTVFLTVLTGCSPGGRTSQPSTPRVEADPDWTGTLTVVTNRTDLIETKYKEYAQQFHARYPGLTVQFEALRDYDKNIKIRLASGETPDVMLIPTIPTSDLPKFFLPLGTLGLDKDKLVFSDFKTFRSENYGMPSGVAVSGVVYNKTVFRRAGIPEAPRTLDAFLEACAKLKRLGSVPLASNFKDRWPLQVWTNDVPLLLSGTGAIKNELAAKDAPFQPDSPYVQSMSIVKKLYQLGYLEPNLNDTNWELSKRDLAEGRTAMILTGNWLVNQVIENGARPEEIGFFPFPADNSGVLRATLYPDRYYAVGKNTKHAAAAKAFVKWMLEESDYEAYSGFIPVLKDRKATLPQLQELESFHPQYVEIVKDTDVYSQILNKAQLELPALVQEYMLGDSDQVLDKVNKMWAQIRASLHPNPQP
ncbi:ABC transporter substrate-binding protein [Gorillibacterium sp. sgz5001074]|uniref:ABC transporter substrate-binding protein n=1 Tax=Gorillibacterium sp. sgz5001074 TaxID=3446695 RepID=UPI003F678F8C